MLLPVPATVSPQVDRTFSTYYAGGVASSQTVQGLERLEDFRQWWYFPCIVYLAECDSAPASDDENGALAGTGMGPFRAKHSVCAAHFPVWPEIAAQYIVERPDLAFPHRGVHNRIDADARDLTVVPPEFFR